MLLSILSIIPTMQSEIWGSSLSGFKMGKQKDSGQRLSTGVCVCVCRLGRDQHNGNATEMRGHFGFELLGPLWCLTPSSACLEFLLPSVLTL